MNYCQKHKPNFTAALATKRIAVIANSARRAVKHETRHAVTPAAGPPAPKRLAPYWLPRVAPPHLPFRMQIAK